MKVEWLVTAAIAHCDSLGPFVATFGRHQTYFDRLLRVSTHLTVQT